MWSLSHSLFLIIKGDHLYLRVTIPAISAPDHLFCGLRETLKTTLYFLLFVILSSHSKTSISRRLPSSHSTHTFHAFTLCAVCSGWKSAYSNAHTQTDTHTEREQWPEPTAENKQTGRYLKAFKMRAACKLLFWQYPFLLTHHSTTTETQRQTEKDGEREGGGEWSGMRE